MSKILVTGDVTIDWLKWDVEECPNKNQNEKQYWKSYDCYEIIDREGGAILLANMIKEILGKKSIIKPEKINRENLINTMCILEKFDSLEEKELCKKTVKELEEIVNNTFSTKFLIKNKLISYMQESGKKNLVKSFFGFKPPKNEIYPIDHEEENPDIVLIHDSGFYFRHKEKYWPKSLIDNNEALYIHKMDRPLANGKLWETIIKKPNLIVVIRANDLREKGLRISRGLSWERTAYDFLNEMEKIRKEDNELKNSELKQLSKCPNLIVRFGVDGAILYQNKKEYAKYTLFFDSEVFEGGIEHEYAGYYMKGIRSAFVSGLMLEIQNNSKDYENNIIRGIKKGIVISRNLLKIGFLPDKDDKMDYPFKKMFDIGKKEDNINSVVIGNKIDWKIIDKTLLNEEEIYQAARQIVKRGKTKNLKAPVAEFGNLSTVDRGEIEGYHSIKNLINEYLDKKNATKPLSIAVFGPPGAGKSFGVTEIANSISEDIKKLEFNLSQFKSPNDLFSAFHTIQSTSLSGKTPLVFFDEFDSDLDNVPYGWLKYFLAPMNDGNFKQEGTDHPIGKCIFVFAGGRKKTFAEFEKDNEKSKVKGSDFISRLRGYVNIVGINRSYNDYRYEIFYPMRWQPKITNIKYPMRWQPKITNINKIWNIIKFQTVDNSYMIRRAMVLRTILEKNTQNIFEESNDEKIAQINDSVLNALIKVPEYKHGNRSMEAIIEMSTLSNKKRFDRSALPSSEQLELHVDKEEFKKYLNEPLVTSNV